MKGPYGIDMSIEPQQPDRLERLQDAVTTFFVIGSIYLILQIVDQFVWWIKDFLNPAF